VVILTAEATRHVCGPREPALPVPQGSELESPATPRTPRDATSARSGPRTTGGRRSRRRPSDPTDATVEAPDALAKLAEAFVAAARGAATHRLPGVEVTPHWVRIEPSALAALLPPGPEVSPYRLTRAIAEHPACRLDADGRIAVRRT
jgi:hypothetical protein